MASDLGLHCLSMSYKKDARLIYGLSSGFLPISLMVKETKSATKNIFRKKSFLFKSFVKVELSFVFTMNLFTIAENCMEK